MTRYEERGAFLYIQWRYGDQSSERFVSIIAAALQAEADRITERDASIAKYVYADLAERAIRNAAEKEKADA